MLLSEIFDQLNYGELSQVVLGGADESGIAEESYPALVAHLNMGLIELHKRFLIRKRQIDLQLYSTIDTYYLKEQFALNSGSAEPIKYLLDTATDLFTDRVLRIERIETSDTDVVGDLPLNDENDDDTLYAYAYNVLKVPTPNDIDVLTIHYRAGPTKISATNLVPATTDIPIPDTMFNPLVYFIAARAHANVPTLDGHNESTMYMQKFEASVQEIINLGLHENENTTNTRLKDNGWV